MIQRSPPVTARRIAVLAAVLMTTAVPGASLAAPPSVPAEPPLAVAADPIATPLPLALQPVWTEASPAGDAPHVRFVLHNGTGGALNLTVTDATVAWTIASDDSSHPVVRISLLDVNDGVLLPTEGAPFVVRHIQLEEATTEPGTYAYDLQPALASGAGWRFFALAPASDPAPPA